MHHRREERIIDLHMSAVWIESTGGRAVGSVLDRSVSGLQVVCDLVAGLTVGATLSVDIDATTLFAEVRWLAPKPDGAVVMGLRLLPG